MSAPELVRIADAAGYTHDGEVDPEALAEHIDGLRTGREKQFARDYGRLAGYAQAIIDDLDVIDGDSALVAIARRHAERLHKALKLRAEIAAGPTGGEVV